MKENESKETSRRQKINQLTGRKPEKDGDSK